MAPVENPTPCFVCERMRTRSPKKHSGLQTVGDVEECLLCVRQFCAKHKAQGDAKGVCEVNHETYYRRHPQLHGTIYPSLEHLQAETE